MGSGCGGFGFGSIVVKDGRLATIVVIALGRKING